MNHLDLLSVHGAELALGADGEGVRVGSQRSFHTDAEFVSVLSDGGQRFDFIHHFNVNLWSRCS